MGCNISSNAYKSKKHSYRVSNKHIKIVRNSWKDLCECSDFKIVGSKMMIKIFLENEDIRPLWTFAANLKTEEEMKASPQLKSHGNKIFEAIGAAVNSLDKTEVLNDLLFQLGVRHKTYGVKTEHFPIIYEAYLFTIKEALGVKYTKEVDKAWRIVLKYFILQMSQGMNSS